MKTDTELEAEQAGERQSTHVNSKREGIKRPQVADAPSQ